MLKSITVENYRSFREKAVLRLSPLTILLGKNSSGKSSLTRLIPLLQQSLERQSSSPLLWTSDFVDLGNITDVITHGFDAGELRIGIRTGAPDFFALVSRSQFRYLHQLDQSNTEVEYTIRLSADGIRTRFNGLEIRFNDQVLSVDWDHGGTVTGFQVNGTPYSLAGAQYTVDTKSLFPEITRLVTKEAIAGSSSSPAFYEQLQPALATIIHGRTAAEKIAYFARTFTFIPRDRAKDTLRRFPNVVQKKLTEENSKLISDLSFFNDLPQIIRYLSLTIAPVFQNSAYIGPSRASGKRFDRVQELAVNRLDSSGENTAMYVYSLTGEERSSFNHLMSRACGHMLTVEASGTGHVSVKIGREGQPHFENIADVGFGFSQLVPVIAQLHAVRERKASSDGLPSSETVFAVEQPELHLHPAMQKNLAHLFTSASSEASKSGQQTKILVETHSETLVSQLGLLIASGEVKPQDVAVYFVSKSETSNESVLKEMTFDDDGIIKDWPVGFFSAE